MQGSSVQEVPKILVGVGVDGGISRFAFPPSSLGTRSNRVDTSATATTTSAGSEEESKKGKS